MHDARDRARSQALNHVLAPSSQAGPASCGCRGALLRPHAGGHMLRAGHGRGAIQTQSGMMRSLTVRRCWSSSPRSARSPFRRSVTRAAQWCAPARPRTPRARRAHAARTPRRTKAMQRRAPCCPHVTLTVNGGGGRRPLNGAYGLRPRACHGGAGAGASGRARRAAGRRCGRRGRAPGRSVVRGRTGRSGRHAGERTCASSSPCTSFLLVSAPVISCLQWIADRRALRPCWLWAHFRACARKRL